MPKLVNCPTCGREKEPFRTSTGRTFHRCPACWHKAYLVPTRCYKGAVSPCPKCGGPRVYRGLKDGWKCLPCRRKQNRDVARRIRAHGYVAKPIEPSPLDEAEQAKIRARAAAVWVAEYGPKMIDTRRNQQLYWAELAREAREGARA